MCSTHTNRPWWVNCHWCNGCTLQQPWSDSVIFFVLRTLSMKSLPCVALSSQDVCIQRHSITVRLRIVRVKLLALVLLLPENTVHQELHDLYPACFHCSSGTFHISTSPHERFHPIYLVFPPTVLQATPIIWESSEHSHLWPSSSQ